MRKPNLTKACAVALLASAIAGCAPSSEVRPTEPERPPVHHPRTVHESSGPAVLALLSQADSELQAGASERAIAKLENAMRIEPRNPFVWQRLARAHLLQHRVDQAETLALRSISLGRGNPHLELENWRVISAARRERGDAAGAVTAEQKVAELQAQVDNLRD